MGFPGFCTSSFHGTTRSFAFRPYLLHLRHLLFLFLLLVPFPVSISRASSISRSSIRFSPPKVSLSLFASLFIRPNPKPGEPSVGSWTAGLAGRQSQLRSWLKVGARTKYAPVIRLEYKPCALFLPPFFFRRSEDTAMRNSFPCICEFLRNCFEGRRCVRARGRAWFYIPYIPLQLQKGGRRGTGYCSV